MKHFILVISLFFSIFLFSNQALADQNINTSEIAEKISMLKQNIDTFKQIYDTVKNNNDTNKLPKLTDTDMPFPEYLKWGETDLKSKKNIVDQPNTLVFSGGGARGPAYAGVLKYLQETHRLENIHRFIGTSAGSIICTFMSIGSYYESNRKPGDKHFWEVVYGIVEDANFIDFIDNPVLKKLIGSKNIDLNAKTFFTLIPALFGTLIDNYGLCNGTNIANFFKDSLEKFGIKGNISFAELHKLTGKHLVLVSCSLAYRKTAMFDYKTVPDMPVIDAMRASMAIPFIFSPVVYNNDYFVDGGATNNYPINFFDYTPTDTEEKPLTLGIMLFSKNEILRPKRENINDIGDYSSSVMELAMFNTGTVLYQGNVNRTVFIDCGNIGILSFDISKKQKMELINSGYNAIKKYYDSK